MRLPHALIGVPIAVPVALFCMGCVSESGDANPFLTALNEPVDYASVTATDVTEYADAILSRTDEGVAQIVSAAQPTFDNVVREYDAIKNDLIKASNNSYMLFWVSPDSATRAAGLAAFERLDSIL